MRAAKKPIEEVYIPLLEDEDFDFTFMPWQLQGVLQLWAEGHSLACMSKQVKKDPDEIAVLLIDLGRREKITTRRSGARGSCRCLEEAADGRNPRI